MYKNVIACITLLMSTSLCCTESEALPELPERISLAEPVISAHLYTPEEALDSPSLRNLKPLDVEYNKIVFDLQNYPTHQEVVMEVKRLASPEPDTFHPLLTFTIQDDGTFVSADQQHLPLLTLSSKGFLRGERVTCRFRTVDNAISKEISGFPNPAVFKDKTGAITMSAELVSLSPTVYLIEMPAMNEGEEYDIKAVILGNTVTSTSKYTSKTPFHFYPTSKGRAKGGTSYFEVKRKSGELYFLKLPWGTALNPNGNAIRTYSPD